MTADGKPVPYHRIDTGADAATVRLAVPAAELVLTRDDLERLLATMNLNRTARERWDDPARANGLLPPEPVRAEAIPNLGAIVLSAIEED